MYTGQSCKRFSDQPGKVTFIEILGDEEFSLVGIVEIGNFNINMLTIAGIQASLFILVKPDFLGFSFMHFLQDASADLSFYTLNRRKSVFEGFFMMFKKSR